MTLLDDTTRTYTVTPSPSSVLAGVLAALQAVVGSVVVVLAPAVVAWVTGAGSSATWSEAVRVALAAWLLAVGARIDLGGAAFGLTPLGLTLVPFVAAWLSGRRAARALDPHGERIAAGFGRARPVGLPRRATVSFVVTWTLACLALALLASTPDARPVLWTAGLGGAAVGALGVAWGSAAWEAGTVRAGLGLLIRRLASALRAPAVVRRTLRPAAVGLGVHLAAASVLLVLALVSGWSSMVEVHRALEPGVAGGAVLLLLQVSLLPTAVVWAASFLAGPGFSAGAGTSVSPAASDLGALPALPLLGALPQPGVFPGTVLTVLVVPFVAGAALGWVVARRTPHGTGLVARVRTAVDACVASALAGLGFALLCLLASGPAGPGRLADVGPEPLAAGAVLAAELAAGALLALVVLQLAPLAWRRLRRTSA